MTQIFFQKKKLVIEFQAGFCTKVGYFEQTNQPIVVKKAFKFHTYILWRIVNCL